MNAFAPATEPGPLPALYPITPRPAEDSRFNLGLTIAVAEVLAEWKYPQIVSGHDLVRLQQALFTFLYVEDAR